MRYQRLDLNLLAALRLLLLEQNVTRAAQAMHVTQPAMSGILARLREYFGDPLIIQVGRKMELTPLARSLVDPVSDLLVRIDATLGVKPEFDPATTRRRFTVTASDYAAGVLLAQVLRQVAKEAPGMVIDIRRPARNEAVQLESGEIDFLVAPHSFVSGQHAAVNLFEDGFCAVVDKDNALVGQRLDLARFVQLAHIAHESVNKPFFDSWFDRTHGTIRQVVLSTHTFSLLPQLIVGTNRIATMHLRAAQMLDPALPLRRVQLGFHVPLLVQVLQWHKARELDPGNLWLREKIQAHAAALGPVPFEGAPAV